MQSRQCSDRHSRFVILDSLGFFPQNHIHQASPSLAHPINRYLYFPANVLAVAHENTCENRNSGQFLATLGHLVLSTHTLRNRRCKSNMVDHLFMEAGLMSFMGHEKALAIWITGNTTSATVDRAPPKTNFIKFMNVRGQLIIPALRVETSASFWTEGQEQPSIASGYMWTQHPIKRRVLCLESGP